LRLWDVSDRNSLTLSTTIPSGPSSDVAFSPDGHTLAMTTDHITEANEIQLWDIAEPSAPFHTGTIRGRDFRNAEFSADGRDLVVAAFDDSPLELWDVRRVTALSGHLREWSCRAAGGGLTAEEWAGLAPGVPYQDTC
jgi:WD40 repeat protein